MSQKWSYSAAGNFAGTFRFGTSSSSTSGTAAASGTAQGSGLSGYVSGARRTEQVTSGPDGTTVRTLSQNLGELPVTQVRRFDGSGREIESGPAGSANRRIEDVTHAETAEGEKKD